MTPAELRARIDTFVILMMENRSFDHILGYLSLPPFGARADVDGLTALDNADYANPRLNGRIAYPFITPADDALTNDLPHERQEVAVQLAYAGAAGGYVMNGFVKMYEMYTATTGIVDPPPMRVMTPPLIPVTSFLADEYLVCDRWHAPLPTSTHPNRLMALSGYSSIDKTGGLLPDQDLVFDWLDRRDIRWRVYSAGLSMFMLIPKMWPWLLTDRFRSASRLAYDVQHESDATFPQVIIVEPDYNDSPVHLSGHGNDNHPPLPVSFGEIFIKAVYEALTSNPARWAKTLLALHYDEHGGFFDHVPPLRVPQAPPPGASYEMGPFTSTGPRVPALLISPYAPRRTAAHGFFDHTSVLQMLADRFDASGAPYSESVEARRQAPDPIGSVTEALAPEARPDTPHPRRSDHGRRRAGQRPAAERGTDARPGILRRGDLGLRRGPGPGRAAEVSSDRALARDRHARRRPRQQLRRVEKRRRGRALRRRGPAELTRPAPASRKPRAWRYFSSVIPRQCAWRIPSAMTILAIRPLSRCFEGEALGVMTSDESFRISTVPSGTGRHTVHFYDRDEELADRVASFIGEGLAAGEAAVIIASEAHRELVIARLRAMNIDLEAQRLAGNLTILDAAGTLARLMVGDMPDQTLFRRVVGGAIESSATRGSESVNVRAYGEMVDILWRGGNRRGALTLEELWTELAGVLQFDLLCAYSTDGFQDVLIDDGLDQVCDRHTHLISSPITQAGNLDGATPIVEQARALAAEVAYRGQIEQALRARIQQLREAEAQERERGLRSQHLAEELQDTVRVNQLFTGVLAHDLRAPLAAIMTAAQLMKLRDTSADGPNAKAIRRVLASGDRMSRMIEQLLDFTRLRVAGGIAIEPKATDLASLVRQVVDELDLAYPDCTVQVTDAGDTNGVWDGDRLAQVFSNLVANAFQHGVPAAGVRVFVDGSAADVVQVQVHNMGSIPAALIPQVFDPLTGGQRRRDRSRGLGLGLFITERIAAAHAGRVGVSSNEADGTTFTVTLPRFTTTATAASTAVQEATRSAANTDHQSPSASRLATLAHEQLRDTEARFQLLVDAVKDYAIFMLDADGRVVTWNAGAERIKGYAAREIIGRHFSQFYEDEEVRAGKCERELEEAARVGRFEDEGWRVRKDGSRFWANVVITALRTPNGELVGFAKVTRDLTERRRAELERVELAKAEEAIRLRDEFLSLAAHELKTPLTVLQMQLDTLHNRVDESGLRTAAKLQRASQSSERLASLVESLLDVSRIATGRFELDVKEFDIVDSVENVVEGLRPSAEKAKCDLTVDARGSIVGAWDRLRLEQALTNLLANAIKYGAGKPIAVSIRRHGSEVMLQVRDHGPGFPETELGRLFRRFERAASIRNYGGLGLGLYFIQAIVDAHGGSVTAQNMPDGGARFQITLPLHKTTAPIEIMTQPADVN